MVPLENSEWEDFVDKQNKFEILEKMLVQHAMKLFEDMVKKMQDATNSTNLQEQQGFMMNLTSKVVDNIQVSIKNIHIRFED